MTRKKRLGRGLEALLNSTGEPESSSVALADGYDSMSQSEPTTTEDSHSTSDVMHLSVYEIEDNPFMYCQNALPAIMDSPNPIEFVLEDGDIVLRHEELGVVRRIHLDSAPAETTPNAYGISVGRWEDDTLVVTTTDLDFPWFDQAGIPQSDALQLIERFSVSTDDRYLNYSVTATDSAVFTEPVELTRRWLSVPGEAVRSYECSWEADHLGN